MTETLNGRKAVIVVADGFEDLELLYPKLRLQEAGMDVTVAGVDGQRDYKGKRGLSVRAEASTQDAAEQAWDLVLVPGGFAPDKMRMDDAILSLVRSHDKAGRPLAAICHAGWVLASAGIVKGRTMTSYPSIRDDLRNAGADVVDEEVVVDGNLVTSRWPADLPAFMRQTLALVAGAKQASVAAR